MKGVGTSSSSYRAWLHNVCRPGCTVNVLTIAQIDPIFVINFITTDMFYRVPPSTLGMANREMATMIDTKSDVFINVAPPMASSIANRILLNVPPSPDLSIGDRQLDMRQVGSLWSIDMKLGQTPSPFLYFIHRICISSKQHLMLAIWFACALQSQETFVLDCIRNP